MHPITEVDLSSASWLSCRNPRDISSLGGSQTRAEVEKKLYHLAETQRTFIHLFTSTGHKFEQTKYGMARKTRSLFLWISVIELE